MTFSYGADLTTDRDQVRFLIEDTDPAMPYFEDEELDWLLSEWMPRYNSVYYVASVAADKLAVKFASMPNVSADGVSVSLSSLSEQFRALAANLRETHKSASIDAEVDLANIMVGTSYDRSIRPLRFAWGLHDNPMAGNQDYGGITPDPWDGEGTRGDMDWGYY